MKKKRKISGRKLLSYILTLVMILGLMPGMSLTAFAYDGNPYASLVNTTTKVKFNGYYWYIIEDNSTAVDAGTVTLLAADTSFGTSVFSQNRSNDYSNSTVKGKLDVLTASGGSFADVADAIVDTDNGKLYLLSTTEANALSNNVREINFTGGSCEYGEWWLRSTGNSDIRAAFVYGEDGYVDVDGYDVLKVYGVRPALKLNLESVIFESGTNTFSLRPAGYNVTITAGSNMTKTTDSGAASQTGVTGAITDVVYTANDGYYFPTDYSVATVNGISVTRNSYTQITVSGAPTADTEITLTAPTEKSKETTPTATFTVTGAYEGTLSGVANGMKYSLNNGTTWTDVSSDANIELTGLSGCTIQVVKKGGNTTADSDPQEITVAQASKPTAVAAHCTSKDNNDGKLTGVTTAMEYKKSDAENWTDGTGSDITGLLPGTYFVRVKVTDTTLASENQALTIEPFERTNPFEGRVYNIGDVLYLSNYCVVNFKDGNNRNIYWTAKTEDASYYYGETYQIPTPTWNESRKNWTFPDFMLIYSEDDWYYCSMWLGLTDDANGGEIVTGVKCTGGDGTWESPYTFALAYLPRVEATAEGFDGAYDGSAHGITVTVTDPTSGTTVKYGTAEGTYNLDASPEYTDAGDYTVYYEVTADGRSTLRGSADINIAKADVTVIANDQSIYVGGEVPDLSNPTLDTHYTVTGLVGSDTLTTTPTLAYQKDGEAANPDNTTAGTYDIVPSGASAGNNYNISYTNGTLTISDKGTQTITADDVTATYGDTDKAVSASVTDPATGGGAISYTVKTGSEDYIEVDAATGALTIKKVPADGKAYVIVTADGTDDYAETTREVTITINKADAVAAAVTANNIAYDGTEKPLVTVTGEPTGGEMQYALGNETEATEPYTTSIPSKTEVGTYYVWYKVAGDDNHLDTNPLCVKVKIMNTGMFADIEYGTWKYTAAEAVYEKQIMVGKGMVDGKIIFAPDDKVNRSQIVTSIYAMDGKPDVDYVQRFSDVKESDWFAKAVTWASNNEITAGTGDGQFGATGNATREQVAVMLYKYAQYCGYDVTISESTTLDGFADADKVHSWALDAVKWAVERKIISGKGKSPDLRIAPDQSATRIECAAMLNRFSEVCTLAMIPDEILEEPIALPMEDIEESPASIEEPEEDIEDESEDIIDDKEEEIIDDEEEEVIDNEEEEIIDNEEEEVIDDEEEEVIDDEKEEVIDNRETEGI